jgi:hypothetical protein
MIRKVRMSWKMRKPRIQRGTPTAPPLSPNIVIWVGVLCFGRLKLLAVVTDHGWAHVYTILFRSKTKQRQYYVCSSRLVLGECEECLKVPSSAIETMNVTKLVVGMEASPLY